MTPTRIWNESVCRGHDRVPIAVSAAAAAVDDCCHAAAAAAATVAVATNLSTNHSSVENKSNQCCFVVATKVFLPCKVAVAVAAAVVIAVAVVAAG